MCWAPSRTDSRCHRVQLPYRAGEEAALREAVRCPGSPSGEQCHSQVCLALSNTSCHLSPEQGWLGATRHCLEYRCSAVLRRALL